jgi:quercetin dioxygenase-like cupin family protein
MPGFETAYRFPGRPKAHVTPTVDYIILFSGELWLELDDGQERLMKPGDVVVQNGTVHAWHNRGAEPAVIYAVMIGADEA